MMMLNCLQVSDSKQVVFYKDYDDDDDDDDDDDCDDALLASF